MMIYSNLAAAGRICKMDCDGQVWLSTYCSALNIQAHVAFMQRIAYPFLSSLPEPPSLRRKRCFYRALPLFTCFFVLACHIISLSDDIASLQTHNEEVVEAQRLVSLHWGYHQMFRTRHCLSASLFSSWLISSTLCACWQKHRQSPDSHPNIRFKWVIDW